ncbi:hypothetical protein Tco_1360908 [Tanacetum coccineum]
MVAYLKKPEGSEEFHQIVDFLNASHIRDSIEDGGRIVGGEIAELEKEDRQRIVRVHKPASSFNVEEWEDIQARVEADKELVQRLQAKEREKYTEAEQARMLAELINQRKRYFAAKRVDERRNKPPTQA